MKVNLPVRGEFVAAGGALALLVAVVATLRVQSTDVTLRHSADGPVRSGGKVDGDWPEPLVGAEIPTWSAPGAAGPGARKRPTELFDHPWFEAAGVGERAVNGAGVDSALSKAGASGAVRLLAVKREPFRVQLTGFLGEGENLTGVFVGGAGDTLHLARAGQQLGELNLELRDIAVVKTQWSLVDDEPNRAPGVQAVLFDQAANVEVRLTDREEALTDTLLAVVQADGATHPPREVREGDVMRDAHGVHRVERIQLTPPELVLATQAAETGAIRRQVLQSSGSGGSRGGHASGTGDSPATGAW